MPKKDEKVDMVTTCPECGSKHISRDHQRGELMCEDCGLILESTYIDQGPEWRAFNAEQRKKRARTGAPMSYTRHDKGLSTKIGWKNRDSYGKPISGKKRSWLYRLRKWQRRASVPDAVKRNLSRALRELKRMAGGTCRQRQLRDCEVLWEGSRSQSHGPRNTNRIRRECLNEPTGKGKVLYLSGRHHSSRHSGRAAKVLSLTLEGLHV